MRAGMVASAAAALPQSLSPEAAAAVAASASDAARRRHPHTTPLHVAAALLSLPSALLRRACSLSLSHPHHPHHPLHCRALDLCFSVALDRLPSTAPNPDPNPNPNSSAPPLSNALVAALKRAHGHARHGGVELAHLALAVLDDPSVSRVMREASFSSPAIKATLHLLSLPHSPSPSPSPSTSPDAAKVLEVLRRPRKRNPILVGDSGTAPVATEALLSLRAFARVVSLPSLAGLELPRVRAWARHLGALIEARAGEGRGGGGGVVVDLGDLTWLVGMPRGPAATAAVAEVAAVLRRLRGAGAGAGHVWLLGTATCATYLRCQVYHPTMEADWDLQALPIAPRRHPTPHDHRADSSVDIFLAPPECNSEALCPACARSYEHELSKLFAEQFDAEHISQSKPCVMPKWLQNEDREIRRKQKSDELRDRWRETCERLHRVSSVTTDLVLGPSETKGGISSECDSLKRLCQGLVAKVGWQRESASAVASAVIRNKSGNGKPRGLRPKADTWLLFTGPDKVGKGRMAYALSELVFGGPPISIRIGYARIDDGDGESDVNLRGKTAIDRVADALRRNPFCVVVLEDIDHADAVVKGVIKRAIETGRLADSHGKEVGLGSAVFVLMSNCSSGDIKGSGIEEKLLESAHSSWLLELSLVEETRTGKRRHELLSEEGDRIAKTRKGPEGISLDLNLAVGVSADDDSDGGEGSRSSSDLTVDHEHEYGRLAINNCSTSSNTADFVDVVDDAIAFKPVDFGPLRQRISDTITEKFTAIAGNACSLLVDMDALDRLVGTVWLSGGATTDMFNEWSDRVLVPAVQKLKNSIKLEDESTVRLSSVKGRGRGRRRIDDGDTLPSSVRIAGV